MRRFLFLLLCLITSVKGFSQDDPIPQGYKLNKSQSFVYAYRNSNNMPDFTKRKRWDNHYWFKVDKTTGVFENPTTKEKYIRITIPSSHRYIDSTKKWVKKGGYDILVDWEQEDLIDGSDFNTWLWIKKTDFDTLKINYYANIKTQFVLSGLTVPFKFRPKIGTSANSIITGDINLGTFIGVRFAKSSNLGISVGGHLGLSSISLNASNNTAIIGNTSETIQGFIYGYGVVFDVKKQFQIGLVAGFDNALGNLAETYIYQNKNWFSFSLNYKFLDFGKEKTNGPNE